MDSLFREIYVPRAWRDFCESIGVRLLAPCQPPNLPLYYEGKVMKTIFPQNYVYVLKTTTIRHMVSFIDFYFNFLHNFQTKTSPHMFSILSHVTSRVKHSEPGLPMVKCTYLLRLKYFKTRVVDQSPIIRLCFSHGLSNVIPT